MPAVLDFEIAVPTGTQVYPARLHGAACAMLESTETAHTAQHKPFSVGPLIEESTGQTHWRVGWLGSAQPPPIPRTVALGPARCPVRPAPPQHTSFAQLLASEPVKHAELHLISPTFFARKGRDLPLPDPVLIIRSLSTRWDAHAPPELALPAEVFTALLDSVYLANASIETRRAQVSQTMWQTGFVGAAQLSLTKAAGAATIQVFTALTRFAEFAGIGAQTTHGFGAARLMPPR